MEFREAVRIGVRAEGLDADRGQMPVHELVDVLSAVANISRRTTLLVTTRRSSLGPTDLSAAQVLVRSPQSGSFIVELAVQIGTNVVGNLATPMILEVIRRVYGAAIGREYEGADERIEPSLPWPGQTSKPTPPSPEQIAELSETLHPSFKQLSEPVDQSATTISLFDASQSYRQGREVLTIDRAAKEELFDEVVGSDLELFGGRVRSLNVQTRKGILDLEQPRPTDLQNATRSLRFWTSELAAQQQVVSALAANLANNNSLRGTPKVVTVKARRVATRTGRVKRVLIEGLA